MKNAHEVYTRFLSPGEILARKRWCMENIGQRYEIPNAPEGAWDLTWMALKKSYDTGYKWRFKREKDAVLFALKWT